MAINEKRLLACLRDAYKKDGYQVRKHGGYLELRTAHFVLQIRERFVPRKLLGLLVEHIGKLPEGAWECRKGAPASELVIDAAADIITAKTGVPGRRTPLAMNGYPIWQREQDLECLLLDAEFTSILDREDREETYVGDRQDPFLRMEQETARMLVWGKIDRGHEVELKELSRFQWWRV